MVQSANSHTPRIMSESVSRIHGWLKGIQSILLHVEESLQMVSGAAGNKPMGSERHGQL